MRPKQWVKNLVIFAAIVFDRQLGLNNMNAMFRTMAGFVIPALAFKSRYFTVCCGEYGSVYPLALGHPPAVATGVRLAKHVLQELSVASFTVFARFLVTRSV